MNRTMRRKLEKQAKRKLTDEQFKEYKNMAFNEIMELEVIRRCDNVWRKMSKAMIEVMRENRISEERTEKMVKAMAERLRQIVDEEKGGNKDE